MWIGPVGLAETNSRLTFSFSSAELPYAAPRVEHVGDDDALRGGLDAQVDEAGPATSAAAMPSAAASAVASQPASSRGLTPTFLPSCSARLVA